MKYITDVKLKDEIMKYFFPMDDMIENIDLVKVINSVFEIIDKMPGEENTK